MKEMVGGCCVCSDDRGWTENPLVYCDGPGCTVAVHQACYGIVTVPQGNWYCRKCEILITEDKSAKARCELCPNKDGALKLTNNNAWAHVVCALYIPEVRFGNVTTMEPIILGQIPAERYNKTCYICEDKYRGSGRSSIGACMQCNKAGCKQQFHVTCAQLEGLLCEEAGNYVNNVKYCGYCHHHYSKLSLLAKQRKGGHVKAIPPYRPVNTEAADANQKDLEPTKTTSKRKMSTGSNKGNKTNPTNHTEETNSEVENPPKEQPTPPVPNAPLEKLPSSGKRKKGESRTPPAASPEETQRPPTPQANMNPVVSLSGLSIPVTTTITTISTLPGQVSAAAMAASTPTSSSSVVAAEAKRPQAPGVLKETRPNSIVVNVPLEVALPTALPSPNSIAESTSPPPATSPLEISPSNAPAKRVRSQSSEKSDKASRRSSKRSSGSTSASGKLVSPTSNSSHMSKSDSGHSGHHLSIHMHHTNAQNHLASTFMSDTRDKRKVGGLNISTTTNHAPQGYIKEEKDVKILPSSAPHMLGNQLNPASSMAQKMCDTLTQEVSAHSIFTNSDHALVGPARNLSSAHQNLTTPNSNSNSNSIWGNNSIPQTLEQLLERQWEQGSQFLMEQAQHFDIASLLSCLHQLRAENAQLEEHVASLAARRDQLLAVNARLAIPFTTSLLIPTTNTTTTTNSQNSTPQPVENGISMVSPHSQEYRSRNQNSITINSQFQQNSVLVRASSADRRSSQSPGNIFNSTLQHHSSQGHHHRPPPNS